MSKLSAKEIKAESQRINAKNDKLRKVQKRVTMVGAAGICILILILLSGLFVDVEQKHSTSFEVATDISPSDFVLKFMNNLPSVVGKDVDNFKLESDGVRMDVDGVDYKALVIGNRPEGKINYEIKSSEVDIKGKWNIVVSQKSEGVMNVSIEESSSTENLGYRAMLFLDGENRYSVNLKEAIEKLAKD